MTDSHCFFTYNIFSDPLSRFPPHGEESFPEFFCRVMIERKLRPLAFVQEYQKEFCSRLKHPPHIFVSNFFFIFVFLHNLTNNCTWDVCICVCVYVSVVLFIHYINIIQYAQCSFNYTYLLIAIPYSMNSILQ